jgi:hypothetical protein
MQSIALGHWLSSHFQQQIHADRDWQQHQTDQDEPPVVVEECRDECRHPHKGWNFANDMSFYCFHKFAFKSFRFAFYSPSFFQKLAEIMRY